MKWFSLVVLMLALLAAVNGGCCRCGCRKRRFRIYTGGPEIIISGGDIIVNGDCPYCDIRTSDNSAQLIIRG